jgi:hypothetical protein
VTNAHVSVTIADCCYTSESVMDDSDALQQRAYGAATTICTNQKVSFGTLFALYTRRFITKRITSAYAHALSVVLVAYETRGA